MDSDKRMVLIAVIPRADRRLRSACLRWGEQCFLHAALIEESCYSKTFYREIFAVLASRAYFRISLRSRISH